MLNIVLIFSKVPSPGLVKTRLAQNTVLSEKDTALIAEAMLKDTISLSAESNADQIYLGYFPGTEKPYLEKLIATLQSEKNLDKSVQYILQNGSNFDERFGSVVHSAFLKGATNIIVLGADLPYMDPIILNKTFEYLSSGTNKKKVVIGPANGGGIYLVGINKEFNHKWFTKYHLFRGGIELSQFSLLSNNKNLDLILLPAFGDVDLEEDLISLMAYIDVLLVSKSYEGFYFPSYTAKIIDKLGLYIHEIENDTRNRRIGKK